MERARAYGKVGVHLIVNPRATERSTLDKWLTGGRAAAVIAGAFCLSSNRVTDGESLVKVWRAGLDHHLRLARRCLASAHLFPQFLSSSPFLPDLT